MRNLTRSFLFHYSNILLIFLCWNDVRDDERDPAIGFISERAHFDAHGKSILLLFFLFSLYPHHHHRIYTCFGSCVCYLLMGSERKTRACAAHRLWLNCCCCCCFNSARIHITQLPRGEPSFLVSIPFFFFLFPKAHGAYY